LARVLIVGCGCRGRALGERLVADGFAVRGTSRREEGLTAIQAAEIEPALADPERPGTILDLVGDVAVVVFLLGTTVGDEEQIEAIHGPRLQGLLERLVDTPVRGIVYEAAGSIEAGILEAGAELVRQASQTWRIPVAVVGAESNDWDRWVEEMVGTVNSVLSPTGNGDR
jgi:uncharacterized protein YbjT (DUF2867 family)